MNRTLYISRECIHCKKLLLGIHKYDFLKPMFNFIDVNSNPYPDYIKSVPTLVIDQNIIRGDDVFDYLNKIVPMRNCGEHEFITYVEQDKQFYNYPLHTSDLEKMPDKKKIKKELSKKKRIKNKKFKKYGRLLDKFNR